jgi:hypothetical protein
MMSPAENVDSDFSMDTQGKEAKNNDFARGKTKRSFPQGEERQDVS